MTNFSKDETMQMGTVENSISFLKDLGLDAILKTIRKYNVDIPVVQNLDFGHTDPQIPMPYGNQVRINSQSKKIFATF